MRQHEIPHAEMTSEERRIVWVYGAALALFVTHSIDSTRFAEWTLFRMAPTTYVFSYLPVIGIALYGLVALSQGIRNGYWLALLLGLIDAAALFVHAPQFLAGTAFREPLSIAIIVAIEVAGIALVVLALVHLLALRRGPVTA